jgi:hypothetical protein
MSEKQPDREQLKATCVLLSDDDLRVLRELALLRAQRKGGRVSQGGTVRDLIRAEARRTLEAARA